MLSKRKDGSFIARIYKNGRKGGKVQVCLGRIPYPEARREHKRLVAEAAEKRGAHGQKLTLSTLANEYLEVHGPKMAPKSRERAEEVIRLYLKPVFGAKPVGSIRAIDVEKYRLGRLAAGAMPSTVNREWAILKAILNKAEAWELIDRNPIRRRAVSLLPVENHKPIYFEPEEWAPFIGAFDNADGWQQHISKIRRLGQTISVSGGSERRFGGGRRPDSEATAEYLGRLRCIVPVFRALLYTGSRLNEVLALDWEDVDLRRNIISIRQAKTRRSKTIPISSALRDLLLSLPQGIGKAPVFARHDGVRLRDYEVQRAFAVAKEISGVRDELTPHSIRHTFASWLAIQGTPLRTIQELLGHADVRMTLRYAHLSPTHLQAAVEAIANVPRFGVLEPASKLFNPKGEINHG